MTGADVVLPDGYGQTLEALKSRVREARVRTLRTVNTELIKLYWHIGHEIRTQQERQGWGSKVVRQLAEDLRAEFPDMTGLSRSNLQYMRAFAGAWTSESIVQQAVGQLPWGHIITLLDKLDDETARQWYAAAAVEYGWSRNVLLNMIMNNSMQRTCAARSNFTRQLSSPDSELAQQVAKDPYAFEFLGLSGEVAEWDLEQALTDRIVDTRWAALARAIRSQAAQPILLACAQRLAATGHPLDEEARLRLAHPGSRRRSAGR